MAAASVINASAFEGLMSGWNRIRKTIEFLRKLSLKAEKNWVQNRGAKRRVRSKDEDMAGPVVGSSGAGPNDYRDKFRLPTGAKGLNDDNLGKGTIGRPPDREATGNPCKRLVWR